MRDVSVLCLRTKTEPVRQYVMQLEDSEIGGITGANHGGGGYRRGTQMMQGQWSQMLTVGSAPFAGGSIQYAYLRMGVC